MSDETQTIDSLLEALNDEIRRQVKAERLAAAEAGETDNRAMSAAALAAIAGLLRDPMILFEEFAATLTPTDRGRLLSVGTDTARRWGTDTAALWHGGQTSGAGSPALPALGTDTADMWHWGQTLGSDTADVWR